MIVTTRVTLLVEDSINRTHLNPGEESIKPLTTYQIKLIAITAMVIDHIGLFFFPQILVFRIVGRLAFPLFAWLIANGAYYSKNIKKYLARLFFFALVAQIPFIIINRLIDPSFWELNVLFTLFLGLSTIFLIKKSKNRVSACLIIMLNALIASFFNTEYGAMGVLAVVIFYLFFKDFRKMIILQICLFTLFCITPIIFFLALTREVSVTVPAMILPLCLPTWIHVCLQVSMTFPPNFIPQTLIEPLGLCSLIFVAFYGNQEGKKNKYFFYWFYPIHLVILYLIKLFI